MPLKSGKSRKVISQNIKTELAAKQAAQAGHCYCAAQGRQGEEAKVTHV